MYATFVNWFSATKAGSFIVKHFASRVDPLIFKATNGRFTSTGPPTLPQLMVTMKGRKSGKLRSVQLAYHEEHGNYFVVASAMGQERHPAWRYNLEANPDVEIQVRGGTFPARAHVLSDAEKERVWPSIKKTIPQMNVYEQRTNRKIRVFRLERTS